MPVTPRMSFQVMDGAMMVRMRPTSSLNIQTGRTPYVSPSFGSVSNAGRGKKE